MDLLSVNDIQIQGLNKFMNNSHLTKNSMRQIVKDSKDMINCNYNGTACDDIVSEEIDKTLETNYGFKMYSNKLR